MGQMSSQVYKSGINIKIGPGDEANLEVDEPHDYDTVFVMKGGGWVFDGTR